MTTAPTPAEPASPAERLLAQIKTATRAVPLAQGRTSGEHPPAAATATTSRDEVTARHSSAGHAGGTGGESRAEGAAHVAASLRASGAGQTNPQQDGTISAQGRAEATREPHSPPDTDRSPLAQNTATHNPEILSLGAPIESTARGDRIGGATAADAPPGGIEAPTSCENNGLAETIRRGGLGRAMLAAVGGGRP